MRILTISNCPLLEHQGSGYVIVNYARGLRERGHDVDLCGPEDFEVLRGVTDRAKTYRQVLGMRLHTAKLLRKKEYDVVEFYGGESWLMLRKLAAKPLRKFLTVLHSNGIEKHMSEWLSKYSLIDTLDGRKRKFYQTSHNGALTSGYFAADGVVTVSFFEKEYAKRSGMGGRFGAVGIDNPIPDIFLRLTPAHRRDRVLGFCGAWLERKGIRPLCAAAARLLEEFPQWRLLLVGVGANFDPAIFPPAIRERIEFIPQITDKGAMIGAYQRMSILMMPSYYESFGLVAAEAMACGAALVATRVGFAAALEDGREAFLIDRAEEDQLYEACKRAMTNDSLRNDVATNGWRRVQSLQWSAALDKLEGTYKQWLEKVRSDGA